MDGYADRAEAGRRLAPGIVRALGPDAATPLVLGLPRGGVPVAAAVAEALDAPLDVLLVRKLGVPRHAELAFGAIASGGARVLNPDVVALARLGDDDIASVTATEERELRRREHAYRGDRPPPRLRGRTVVVVDDGLATGATMRAAVLALRALDAARVVAAAPVGSDEACALVAEEADALVCPLVPDRFRAVGLWYEDFGEVGDDDVRRALRSFAHGGR
ncbi:MAG TPA: phosphoribosyltransferase family protein [Baekduia sp.]|uniref:phosphoribosyltransferase n=1 Tax=Baekduia sp. TaxID=2600305 RepID=UPI002D792423|nr:phosphoribosyltransferase family protein [Baekduia sp.]HET6509334.1 phosphoribosyltransferase family protein [Baekduia sp.]